MKHHFRNAVVENNIKCLRAEIKIEIIDLIFKKI